VLHKQYKAINGALILCFSMAIRKHRFNLISGSVTVVTYVVNLKICLKKPGLLLW